MIMRKAFYSVFFLLLTSIALQSCVTKSSEPADLVILNAKVWTGDPVIFEEAIAVRGNTIMVVGKTDEVRKHITDDTHVVDAKGKLITPGFNDAHIHFLSGATGLSEVELSTAYSLEEMAQRIRDFVRANPDRSWITGRGWQYTVFPGGMPTKLFLDTMNIDRPIFLRAYDGHSGLANSKALEVAGVNRQTSFTGFGEIIRDAKGNPTGALTERAQGLVSKFIPPLTREDKLNALRTGMKVASSLGITSIQNASGSVDEFSLYEELYEKGEMTLRSSTAFSVGENTTEEDIQSDIALRDKVVTNPFIRAGAIKFMLDGVIESHTAAMIDPYSDFPVKGNLSMKMERYRELVSRLDQAGFQLYTHAIGDLAVRETLNAYEQAMKDNGTSGKRHRIEHIETISSEDIPRFSQLGVLPSMEPIHAEPATVNVWSKAVGEERLPNSFAWASFLKSNAMLVFSSDWPACISLDPIYGLHVAVTRCTPDGDPPGGWIPEQKISVQDALSAYTYGGAYASFDEQVKGRIAPGYLADIIILSKDLFSIDPLIIHQTKVALTIVDGKIVHQDSDLLNR
jgi:predicted amidohydrolase YtcJ